MARWSPPPSSACRRCRDLVVLYAGLVKRKWALNFSLHGLYGFARCHALLGSCGPYKNVLCEAPSSSLGEGGPCCLPGLLDDGDLLNATAHYKEEWRAGDGRGQPYYPMASMRCRLQHMGRRFSFPLGNYGLLPAGMFVHVASGAAGFTAAYWVGPRLKKDRDDFPPNNIVLALVGAGILWMGWTGFNGGDPFAANVDSSIAVLNTHICASTSLLVWTCWDIIVFGKPSLIGSIQGMITGLVCITPAAGLVQGWAALIMGIASGSIPWFTMMSLQKKSQLLQKVDDTLGILHTHAVAGTLGGALTGLFAHPTLCSMFLPVTNSKGAFYGKSGGVQFLKQLVGAAFVIGWNMVVTSIILLVIRLFIPLRMSDEELAIGDEAAHGEEAYAPTLQGEKYNYTPQTTTPNYNEGLTPQRLIP
ncbi:ammonium transporter 3 member 1-like protein [Cinnamomum micranthum f. kanehirae]|uniref:Ammonium transporter 3 member 1-like protein n=1 Tax=Cinnamomum micranthum f. kanehirae TaxID=337451 RepID=A0A3S3NQ77_9MAGN|nr:ammonium transporter 3 member 1-like protein [Cinnamomum micranthum f. kanehirae]